MYDMVLFVLFLTTLSISPSSVVGFSSAYSGFKQVEKYSHFSIHSLKIHTTPLSLTSFRTAINAGKSDDFDVNTSHENDSNTVASRRSCISRIVASAGIFATSYECTGWIESMDTNRVLDPSASITWSDRYGPDDSVKKFTFSSVQPALAYDRDVGADGIRSADTYAQNLQAKKTNARLEAGGFKLDSKEEETARLNEAFASFSYSSNSNTGKSNKAAVGKGYGTNNNNGSSKSK
mmetsp:Transcript_2727/g.3877  ORF Transcript_2727/g.3877 Transcript_2727/m.3877 type:complete len:235 (+) Transcript_2727:53-757(+)